MNLSLPSLPRHLSTRALAVAIPLLFAYASVVSGCGRSRCGVQCGADPEPPAAQRRLCEEGTAPFTACQAEFDALSECSAGRTVCRRDDRTDTGATTQVVLEKCGPQVKAYTDCTSVPR